MNATRTWHAADRPASRLAVWILTAAVVPLPLWDARATAQEDEPAATEDTRLEDFPAEHLFPGREQLGQLLGRVPGEKYEINERTRDNRTRTQIVGLFRLNPSWRADRTFRLEILEPSALRLYLWNGPSGLSVEYRREAQNAWAVYGVTRRAGGPEPDERTLWATDSGRYRRSGAGHVDLTVRDGRLVMSRGDLRLLSVPFTVLPSETFLECDGVVRGIAWLPPAEVPPALSQPGPASLSTRRPAELKWEKELGENCRFVTLPDGRVGLDAGEKHREGRAWLDVGPPRLAEFIFEVEEPEAGAGLWIGDEQGRELCRVGFYEGRERQDTVFALTYPGDSSRNKSFDPRRHIIPYAGRTLWLRLVVGAGAAKLWTSVDGVDWSQPATTCHPVNAGCRRVGLYVNPGERPTAIKLRSFEVRRFDAIESLVEKDLLRRAAPFSEAEDVEQWESLAAESRPEDVPEDAWIAACAVATLAAGPRENVGQALLERIALQAVPDEAKNADLGGLLELLDETALLYSSRDWNAGERLQSLFDRVGLALGQRGCTSPFSLMSAALMRSPFWQDRRLDVFSDRLLRYELFALADGGHWEEMGRLCRRTRFWNDTPDRRDGQPPWSDQAQYLIGWAAARAASHGAGDTDATATIANPRWGDVLVARFSKEGYNVLAEMAEAIRVEAYDEACRIITGSAAAAGAGLLPDGEDPRLSVSLKMAVSQAMREHPNLLATMVDQFAPIGEIRLKEATGRSDAEAVAMVARQFPGTEVAAAAHSWLGDRELAAGRFGRALAEYAHALDASPSGSHNGHLARRRLAGAMQGQDLGDPIASTVQIGRTRLSPPQFEALADELQKAHASGVSAAEIVDTTEIVPPGTYELIRWARVEAQGAKYFGDRSIDWAGRQMAVSASNQQMIVNSRTDLAALDAENGGVKWADRPDLGDRARRWPLETMRPLVSDGRIYLRRLTEDGLKLVCVEEDNGRTVWTADLEGPPISNPLVTHGELVVFAARGLAGSKLAISLAVVDSATGNVRRQAAITEFHDVWEYQIPCRVTAADSLLVATIGGCVLACDRDGQLRWVRRQIWMPPPGDYYNYTTRHWLRQIHEPPIVADGRVYATQVGVWGIECVELETGRLVWRTPICDLERVVGLASGMLIVQSTSGMAGVDVQSGVIAWSHDVAHPQQAGVDPTDEVVFYCRTARPDGDKKPGILWLDWLDSRTGELRRQTSATMPAGLGPLVGPIVSHGDRRWVFLCPAKQEGWHDVFRLDPAAAEPNP